MDENKFHEIVVISGKGGTGKTTLMTALACLLRRPRVLADADVDASNLPLSLSPEMREEEIFRAGWQAQKDEGLCKQCGLCREKCRFEAIDENFSIDPWACEGCGVCAWFCPEGAIFLKEKEVGKLFLSETPFGPLVHAELFPGEENSGKLVAAVKEKARRIAEERAVGVILIDGAPGVGCPVIASLSGATAAVVVSEPTPAGEHDLERVIGLLKHFKIPGFLVVNKADLEPHRTNLLLKKAEKEGLSSLGTLPYDEGIFRALGRGRPWPLEYDGPLAEALKTLAEKIDREVLP